MVDVKNYFEHLEAENRRIAREMADAEKERDWLEKMHIQTSNEFDRFYGDFARYDFALSVFDDILNDPETVADAVKLMVDALDKYYKSPDSVKSSNAPDKSQTIIAVGLGAMALGTTAVLLALVYRRRRG
jgi:hypothetical protein